MNFEHLDTNQGENMTEGQPQKKEAFQNEAIKVDHVRQFGFEDFLKVIKSNDSLDRAFDLTSNTVHELAKPICCMDEGTPFGIHSAGSGILLSETEFENFIQQAKPTAITSHDGCGAAKLYCQKNGIVTDNPDEVAKQWALDMAKKYGLEYAHIDHNTMNRDNFHDAQVAYVDATGKFNYTGSAYLPKGFVVNWKQGEAQALAECTVAANIAFGDHGLGNLLSEEKPFVYVAIGKTPAETELIKQRLNELKNQFGDKIIIDGFTAPSN